MLLSQRERGREERERECIRIHGREHRSAAQKEHQHDGRTDGTASG